MLIKPDSAGIYSEGKEALSILSKDGEQFVDVGIAALSDWSVNTPRRASREAIADVLAHDWIFAEAGARKLLMTLGLIYPGWKEGDDQDA